MLGRTFEGAPMVENSFRIIEGGNSGDEITAHSGRCCAPCVSGPICWGDAALRGHEGDAGPALKRVEGENGGSRYSPPTADGETIKLFCRSNRHIWIRLTAPCKLQSTIRRCIALIDLPAGQLARQVIRAETRIGRRLFSCRLSGIEPGLHRCVPSGRLRRREPTCPW